jgi:hypothetical protein
MVSTFCLLVKQYLESYGRQIKYALTEMRSAFSQEHQRRLVISPPVLSYVIKIELVGIGFAEELCLAGIILYIIKLVFDDSVEGLYIALQT